MDSFLKDFGAHVMPFQMNMWNRFNHDFHQSGSDTGVAVSWLGEAFRLPVALKDRKLYSYTEERREWSD
ncbi:unnamed protein product [Arctogadus glacialis]